MNKKLLAVAIASAVASPLAMADEGNVTVYGTASVAVENVDIDNLTTTDFDATQVNNNHSALGIKGWESVGNGLKAVFLLDMFVGLDSGNSSGATNGSVLGGGRDGYVGLQGGFGTVALGYHGRPWKTSTNGLDLFGSTIADYSAIMGSYNNLGNTSNGSYFDGGIGNAVIWFLPNMNGFSGHIQVGADEADDNTNDYGAQFNYSNGPLYVSLSYDEDGQATGTPDVDVWKLAGSYTFAEATTVTAMYEDLDRGNNVDRSAWYLGVAHKFGSNTAKLAYADADNTSGNNDGAKHWTVGLDHSLSKRTTVYGLYTKLDNDNGGQYSLIRASHTSNYSSPAGSKVDTGAEVSAFSVGIKHNF